MNKDTEHTAPKKEVHVGDIVLVKWEDSSGMSEYWVNHDNLIARLLQCTTVGKIVKQTKNSIMVSQSWNDCQYGGTIEIPWVNVKHLTLLRKCK